MIQRNVVFQSKTDTGESVLNMPITVLKNIEDTAEIKDNISDDDYVPVIDSSDNSQMKKTNFKNAIASKADKSDVEAALDNKSDVNHIHDERYYTESEVDTKLSGKIDTTLKGSANGIAELNENGKVPSSQLPSYVDAVVEYTSISDFPSTGDTGKIYVDTTTNLTYRWSGSAYVEISPSIALGETSSTAYRGDRGKEAYDHIADTTAHITAAERAAWNAKAETDTATTTADGLMSAADKKKLDGIYSTLNTHIADQVKHITAEERAAWNAVNYSNPNLLINPDFKINQRGQDVYSGTMYTADCWKCITSTGQVTVGSGGITVTDTAGGQCKINNYVEGNLTGKTITISACIDGTICKVSGLATADMTTWDKQLKVYFDGGYLLFGCYNAHKFFIMLASAAEKSFSCQWVKLELGSIATPFCPPDTATELAKCQRYYQIRSTNDIDPVDLRPSMRATPTDIKKVTGGYAYVAEL